MTGRVGFLGVPSQDTRQQSTGQGPGLPIARLGVDFAALSLQSERIEEERSARPLIGEDRMDIDEPTTAQAPAPDVWMTPESPPRQVTLLYAPLRPRPISADRAEHRPQPTAKRNLLGEFETSSPASRESEPD